MSKIIGVYIVSTFINVYHITGVPNDNFFRIEQFSAKMICECRQTDFWLIVNFRGKNLSALQSQLAINLTFAVASQNPFY